MKETSQRLRFFAVIFAIFAALTGVIVCYSARPGEVELLKKSIPDAVRFYEENTDVFHSLRAIQEKYENAGENGYWSVNVDTDGSLYAIGLPQRKWDKVTLFDREERRAIERAFSVSYRDISIRHFESSGSLWVTPFNRYCMEMMYFPDEESYQRWIQTIWAVENADEKWLREHWPLKYSEPVVDGWYVFIMDRRPFIA